MRLSIYNKKRNTVLVGFTFALLLMASAACTQNRTHAPQTDQDQLTEPIVATPDRPVVTQVRSLKGAKRCLRGHWATIRRLIPDNDLMDHLYYGWRHDPYRRATLALVLKTLQVSEQEFQLRARRQGMFTNAQLVDMANWVEMAMSRQSWTDWPGYETQTATPDLESLLSWGLPVSADTPEALFTFADRSSITQNDRDFGDFDLFACLGLRAYGLAANRALTEDDVDCLHKRAEALGICLVDVPTGQGKSESDNHVSSVHMNVLTLAELASLEPEPGAIPAVFAPSDGESWEGTLARSALYRGMTGRSGAVLFGATPPPGDNTTIAARTRAAMWMAAIDGQLLGVLEGWPSFNEMVNPYEANLMGSPAYLEAVAHTSLDLQRSSDLLRRFGSDRELGIVMDTSQIDPANSNSWSPQLLGLIKQCMAWQLSFDLRVEEPEPETGKADGEQKSEPRRRPRRRHYEVEVRLPAADAHAEGGVTIPAPPERFLSTVRPFAFREFDGRLADNLYIRATEDQSGVAVINLSAESRSLRLDPGMGRSARPMVDRLSGEPVGPQVALEPFQVRIILPQTYAGEVHELF